MRRWLWSVLALAVAAPVCAGPFTPSREPVGPDGTAAVVDLPSARHTRNTGGSDGLGLCVFTSVQHSADWQNVRALDGFRRWMEKRPGGGWPQKLDQTVRLYCRERGVPVPGYIQHTGGDDAFLDLAIATDRFPAVTYSGKDDLYRGRVAHMVNLAHLDRTRAAIVDNNRPGVWLWMSRADFVARWRDMGGGWAVVLLASPPPPHPDASRPTPPGPPAPQPNTPTPGPQPCPGPGPCPWLDLPAPDDGGRWIPTADGTEWGYWVGKRCVAYLRADGRCLAVDTRGVVTDEEIPSPAPLPAGRWTAGRDNFGLDLDQIDGRRRYSMNGREVSREAALAALLDDSDRWHLSAVGDPAFLARVRADLDGLPADVRGKLHVQLYGPADWPVSHYRLPAGVSLRKPSPVREAADVGRVLPDEYTGVLLAKLLALPGGPIHKPAPEPEPEPEPRPVPGPVGPTPTPEQPPAPLGLLTLIVAAILETLRRRLLNGAG